MMYCVVSWVEVRFHVRLHILFREGGDLMNGGLSAVLCGTQLYNSFLKIGETATHGVGQT